MLVSCAQQILKYLPNKWKFKKLLGFFKCTISVRDGNCGYSLQVLKTCLCHWLLLMILIFVLYILYFCVRVWLISLLAAILTKFWMCEMCNMYMYVRTYVCMYTCMHVCMYVCMYVCAYVRMYICMCVCMYICTYVCTYVCVYACMYVHMYFLLHAPLLGIILHALFQIQCITISTLIIMYYKVGLIYLV
jgi:hypothetical protein